MIVMLGARQLVVIVVSLAAIGTVVVLAVPYDVDAWYWREVVGPALREDLGFETGRIDVNVRAEQLRMFAVTSVRPGGAFDRADIRSGDVFFPGGDSAFYSTLKKARGTVATLDLRRPPDWRPVRVTVEVPSR